MGIPLTSLHALRVLMQCQQNLTGLQHDMRTNAQAWAGAAAGSDPVTLAQNMDATASAYLDRLVWMTALRADSAAWGKVTAIHVALGGSADDFDAIETPLRAAVQQMQLADKSSAAACAQVLASVDAPLSLWPE